MTIVFYLNILRDIDLAFTIGNMMQAGASSSRALKFELS